MLQGDNNGSPDAAPVMPEQVQGRVWYSVPLVGVANSAVNGVDRAWIVPSLAALLIAYAAYSLARGAREAVIAGRGRTGPDLVGVECAADHAGADEAGADDAGTDDLAAARAGTDDAGAGRARADRAGRPGRS